MKNIKSNKFIVVLCAILVVLVVSLTIYIVAKPKKSNEEIKYKILAPSEVIPAWAVGEFYSLKDSKLFFRIKREMIYVGNSSSAGSTSKDLPEEYYCGIGGVEVEIFGENSFIMRCNKQNKSFVFTKLEDNVLECKITLNFKTEPQTEIHQLQKIVTYFRKID